MLSFSAPAAAAATVLLVEDNPLALSLYEQALAGLGGPGESGEPGDIRVLTARNGFDGLVAIATHKPDVVITDLDMPDFDGFRMLDILDKDAAAWPGLMLVVSGLGAWDIARAGGIPSRATLIGKGSVTAQGVSAAVRTFFRDRAAGRPVPAA